MRCHYAHRTAPGQINRAICKMRNCIARCIARDQFDLDALVSVEAKRVSGVIRRIEDGLEVLHESDLHVGLQKAVDEGIFTDKNILLAPSPKMHALITLYPPSIY